MSEKQKQARNNYILITNLQKDFQGMCDELEEERNKIVQEIVLDKINQSCIMKNIIN